MGRFIERFANVLDFAPPAPAERSAGAGAALGVEFPDELRALFGESDGVEAAFGVNLVWPLDRVVAENLAFRGNRDFRDLYMPFNHLLFFGDAGDGDQFAFPIQADGVIHRPDVFAWNHETDGRDWIAPRLEIFLEWWTSGRIGP